MVLPLVLAVSLILFRGHLLPLIHVSPHTYSAAEAANEIGKYATVSGKVAEISISQKGTIFLDFGASYPRQSFTAVILPREAPRLVGLDSYKGRAVAITGRLDLYRGKPEIIVRSVRQVKLVN